MDSADTALFVNYPDRDQRQGITVNLFNKF